MDCAWPMFGIAYIKETTHGKNLNKNLKYLKVLSILTLLKFTVTDIKCCNLEHYRQLTLKEYSAFNFFFNDQFSINKKYSFT